jgi:hypothetical protein
MLPIFSQEKQVRNRRFLMIRISTPFIGLEMGVGRGGKGQYFHKCFIKSHL